MEKNQLNEMKSLIDRMDNPRTGWGTILEASVQHTIYSDEMYLFGCVSSERTGLPLDIFVDQGEAYKEFNHPLWVLVPVSYSNKNELMPITVSSSPKILYDGQIQLTQNDVIEIIKFIYNNQKTLEEIACGEIESFDAFKRNSFALVGENKELLLEMPKLPCSCTGLPFIVWLGVNNKGHFVGIKFPSKLNSNKTTDYAEMSVPDCVVTSKNPYDKKMAKQLEEFINLNKNALIELGNNPYLYDYVIKNFHKYGSDDNEIGDMFVPVSETKFGLTRVKNNENKYNFVDENNSLFSETWFDVANDFTKNANGQIRAYVILNGNEYFLYKETRELKNI